MDSIICKICNRIDSLFQEKDHVLVAIDGNCTAGKSTLAAKLSEIYDCNLLHMDDFFLRPHQRTPQRYAEPGGNVDYERFQEEVLLPLIAGKDFSYQPFRCKTFTLGEPVAVSNKKLTIIEGSYSMHPYFGDPYDLKILLTISAQLQHTRVLERPIFVQQRFLDEWIPMENKYLQAFDISASCDFHFRAE